MVEAVSPAKVFEGAKALVEASELPGFQRTRFGDVGFLLQQGRRQSGTAKRSARSGFEFPQPGTPAYPLSPLLEMRGRAAECQDRNPVAIHFGDIAKVASSDAGALER
jgi:hypothetical protein